MEVMAAAEGGSIQILEHRVMHKLDHPNQTDHIPGGAAVKQILEVWRKHEFRTAIDDTSRTTT
jgi:hypothetical protein